MPLTTLQRIQASCVLLLAASLGCSAGAKRDEAQLRYESRVPGELVPCYYQAPEDPLFGSCDFQDGGACAEGEWCVQTSLDLDYGGHGFCAPACDRLAGKDCGPGLVCEQVPHPCTLLYISEACLEPSDPDAGL